MGNAGNAKKRKGGNPGVGVDFKRVKHKVGKKLPKAQNETRTDFKARAIHLPGQSVTADKGGAAVSERNLTVQELLSQSSHHSERVRKDALAGLQQLLAAHPGEARRHAAALLDRLAARLGDGDAGVREALLQLLRGAVLPALGPATLAPFLPALMAHLEAAVTHLEAPVRLDALAALEGLAAAAPRAFEPAGALLAPCLGHYAALLSRAHRGRSVKAQALSGLARVAASLRRFLAATLPSAADGGGSSSGGDGAAEAGLGAEDAGLGGGGGSGGGAAAPEAAPLMARRCAWAAKPEPIGPAQLLALYAGPPLTQQRALAQQGQAHTAAGKPHEQQQQTRPPKAVSKKRKQHIAPATATQELAPSAGPPSGAAPAAAIATALPAAVAVSAAPSTASAARRRGGVASARAAGLELLAALAACWRECAPATLSTAPEREAAQAVVDVLASALALLRGLALLPQAGAAADAASAHAAGAAASVLLPAVVPALPATMPAARPPAEVAELLAEFNVLAAQLVGAFAVAGVAWPPRPDKAPPGEAGWVGGLLRYIHGVLTTGVAVPAADWLTAEVAPAGGSAAAAATAAGVVLPLLRTVEALLPRLCPGDQQQLLAAVDALAAAQQRAGGAGGGAAVRTACLRLQRGLLLRHLLEAPGHADAAAGVARWLSAAPKALWDLGDRAPAASGVLLSMLFHAARLAQPGSAPLAALVAAQPQIAPLLATALPAVQQQQKQQQQQQQQPKKHRPGQQQQQQQQQQGGGGGGVREEAVPVLVGPLARLPPAAQERGADLIALLAPLDPALVRAVALAARLRVYPDGLAARLLDGVLRGAPASLGPEAYLQLLATLLCPRAGVALIAPQAGAGGGGKKKRLAGEAEPQAIAAVAAAAAPEPLGAGPQRHALVVACVCRWLHRFGPPAELAGLLEDCLAAQWAQHTAHKDAAAARAAEAAAAAAAAGAAAAGPARAERAEAAAAAAAEGARCVALSVVSVVAVAAGTWSPGGAAGAAGGVAGTQGAGGAADGEAAVGDGAGASKETAIPPRLMAVLPAAMAELLRASVEDAIAASLAEEGGSGAAPGNEAWPRAAAAAGAEASTSAAWLAGQVLEAAPQLIPPLADLLADWAAGDGGGGGGGSGSSGSSSSSSRRLCSRAHGAAAGPAADAARLAAAAEALQALLTSRVLLPWWLQPGQEAAVGRWVERLSGAAGALQRATGDAGAAARVERLAAAAAAVYAR